MIRFLFVLRNTGGQAVSSIAIETERSADWGWDYAVAQAEAQQYGDRIGAVASMIDWNYMRTEIIAGLPSFDESSIPAAVS